MLRKLERNGAAILGAILLEETIFSAREPESLDVILIQHVTNNFHWFEGKARREKKKEDLNRFQSCPISELGWTCPVRDPTDDATSRVPQRPSSTSGHYLSQRVVGLTRVSVPS